MLRSIACFTGNNVLTRDEEEAMIRTLLKEAEEAEIEIITECYAISVSEDRKLNTVAQREQCATTNRNALQIGYPRSDYF